MHEAPSIPKTITPHGGTTNLSLRGEVFGEVEIGVLAVEFVGLAVARLGRLDFIVKGPDVIALRNSGDGSHSSRWLLVA